MTMPGAHESMIIIRSIDLISEMREVEELQKEVWGPEDVVPLTHLVAAKEVGGILIGAYDGQRLVGFIYGFIGQEDNQRVIHSHMLAVKQSYRDHDLGYKLKLAQREQALAQGFKRITWTFDPLQSRNAHLNFGKLGVIADQYKINFYGAESPSPLHRHIGTDRLWVSWLLKSRRVHERLERRANALEPLSFGLEQVAPLVRLLAGGAPDTTRLAEALKHQHALIEIPGDIGSLQQHDPELAVAWREATRLAFTEALASGYLVEEFSRRNRDEQQFGVYLLSRGKKVEDFI
jgi:predicted GNAT superfamily acetyltransferase